MDILEEEVALVDNLKAPILMEHPTFAFAEGYKVEASDLVVAFAQTALGFTVAFAQTTLGFKVAFIQITLMVEDLLLTKDVPKH